jgi:carbon-monoxide dehydrogenase small subunit
MLVAAKWLLDREPDAGRERIAEALSGQLCRCTGYLQIYEAVEAAGRVLRGLPAPGPRLPAVHRENGHGRSG